MRFFALLLLVAAAARADQNDLELWRLGHPDDLACTRCDGLAGDSIEPGTIDAQARFHRLTSALGLAFAPPFQETAGSLGESGFELGISSQQVFLSNMPADTWATQGTQATSAAPKVLVLPTLTLRKGLGASLELGAAVSWLANSQIAGLSAEARWAVLDGMGSAPDFALRGWATRIVGARDLDLTSGGADAMVSKSFGLAGMAKLQPYVQGGIAFVNAISSVIDFKPNRTVQQFDRQNAVNPTASEGVFRNVSFFKNRFLRAALGVRLVAGAAVFGLEGALAQGTNDIQESPPPGTPQQFVRVWSGAARIGFNY
ncbi:MAG: hypothetical protein E6J78_13135 [Deltaproteobacteria bacterium]|nr:MAG: hypothetical protein E6J78_13135 [Deltaproteobacteria bacterium]